MPRTQTDGTATPAFRDWAKVLSPDYGLVFRVTHLENVPWILENGVASPASPMLAPKFFEIGNRDLIDRRSRRVVPIAPGGTLSEYVPFYFTPRSPMLLNILTGRTGATKIQKGDLVFLVSSAATLEKNELPFLTTDRHAVLEAASFAIGREGLTKIDWSILQACDFKRNNEDPGKIERYQAEALVHRHVPLEALDGLACHDERTKERLNPMLTERGLSLKLVIRPSWYF